MKSALEGLKVVEIASVLAGPAVGMFFAEKGAEVTKVENKRTNGDVTRSWKLPSEDKNSPLSAYFSSVNWHKKHLFLDFGEKEDLEVLLDLLKDADIVIANFKPGDAEKFGLTFNEIKAINPCIIYAELTGFGKSSSRVAYDLVLQAESGFMSMNGEKDGAPVKMPVAFIDLFAAHQLKEGVLEALLLRERENGAYHVETSLYDAAIASLANQASNYLMAGHIPQPLGSLHPNIAPYGELFTTKDGVLITFAIGSDKQFQSLCETLGIEVKNEYLTNKDRVANRDQIFDEFNDKVKERMSDQLLTELKTKNVPVAQVKNLKEVFSEQSAKDLILEEITGNEMTRRVRTSVYEITKG